MANTVDRTNSPVDSTPAPRFPICPDSGRWIDRGFKQSTDAPIIPWGSPRESASFHNSTRTAIFFGLPLSHISATFEPEYEHPFQRAEGLTAFIVSTNPVSSLAFDTFEYLRQILVQELGPADLSYEIEKFWLIPAHTALVWDSPWARASLYIGDFKDSPYVEFRTRRKYRPQHELKFVSHFDLKFTS